MVKLDAVVVEWDEGFVAFHLARVPWSLVVEGRHKIRASQTDPLADAGTAGSSEAEDVGGTDRALDRRALDHDGGDQPLHAMGAERQHQELVFAAPMTAQRSEQSTADRLRVVQMSETAEEVQLARRRQ